MRKIAVGDIMTRQFISASPKDDIHKCAKIMSRKRVDSLLITQKDKLVGILTSHDIIWAITKKQGLNLKKINAIDIATKKVAVIKPSADISQAIKKMKTLNFRRLPVLSKGTVIGVITLKDILSIDPTIYLEVPNLVEIRERERKIKEIEDLYPLEGFCENCGAFSDLLKVENQLLCPDCREELY